MPDPRIITFSVPVVTGTTTKFNLQFSDDQEEWTNLLVSAATDLDVSLVASRQYVLDGVNATDDTNNNKQQASTPPMWYRVRLKSAAGYGQWSPAFVVPSQADFLLGIKEHLKDDQLKGGPALLSDSDYRRALANAIDAFEQSRPRPASQLYTLTTQVQSYALPDDWSTEFSEIVGIEYPTSQSPRRFIAVDYSLIDEQVSQWRFLRVWPGTSESARLYYTARHARDGSTVAVEDFESVLMWATGDAAEQIRAEKNQFGDLMAGSMFVSIDPRIREWAKIAETWKKQAEKTWGSPGTGVRTHLNLYDDHGAVPPWITSGW